MISPIGLENTFNESWIRFQEKKTYSLYGVDTFFSHFFTEILVFAYMLML